MDEEKEYQMGDLISLVSSRPDVVLGSILEEDIGKEDPHVPVGTVCMVQGPLQDSDIMSEAAYVIVLELSGRLQSRWVYESEMCLVSRP